MEITKQASTLDGNPVPVSAIKLRHKGDSIVVSACTNGRWVEMIVTTVDYFSHTIGSNGIQARVEHMKSHEEG